MGRPALANARRKIALTGDASLQCAASIPVARKDLSLSTETLVLGKTDCSGRTIARPQFLDPADDDVLEVDAQGKEVGIDALRELRVHAVGLLPHQGRRLILPRQPPPRLSGISPSRLWVPYPAALTREMRPANHHPCSARCWSKASCCASKATTASPMTTCSCTSCRPIRSTEAHSPTAPSSQAPALPRTARCRYPAGYAYPDLPLAPAIDAFETLAHHAVDLWAPTRGDVLRSPPPRTQLRRGHGMGGAIWSHAQFAAIVQLLGVTWNESVQNRTVRGNMRATPGRPKARLPLDGDFGGRNRAQKTNHLI